MVSLTSTEVLNALKKVKPDKTTHKKDKEFLQYHECNHNGQTITDLIGWFYQDDS